MSPRETTSPGSTAADYLLAEYYSLLGYPHGDHQVPPGVTAVQVDFIRSLTEDAGIGLETLVRLHEEAFGLEPAWSNLSPEKRTEVAMRSGSTALAGAFGHVIDNGER